MAVTSQYDELTPEGIKANMLRDLEVKGAGVDIREGSYANTLVSAAAYQLWKLYQQFPGLLSMVFPDENAGEYIDKNAEPIGMVRTPGRKAAALLRFTGAEGTFIPRSSAPRRAACDTGPYRMPGSRAAALTRRATPASIPGPTTGGGSTAGWRGCSGG